MQITNLFYVVGALAVATLISAFYVLRHRKPKSLQAGIESFSRELKALAPERRTGPGRDPRSGGDEEHPVERSGVRARPISQPASDPPDAGGPARSEGG